MLEPVTGLQRTQATAPLPPPPQLPGLERTSRKCCCWKIPEFGGLRGCDPLENEVLQKTQALSASTAGSLGPNQRRFSEGLAQIPEESGSLGYLLNLPGDLRQAFSTKATGPNKDGSCDRGKDSRGAIVPDASMAPAGGLRRVGWYVLFTPNMNVLKAKAPLSSGCTMGK